MNFQILHHSVGPASPCFLIAEVSANHNGSYEKAERLVHLAKECGADAVKLQTYTPDTMTLDVDNEYFRIHEGPWKGQTLYQLYGKAYTPWEWQPRLKKVADKIGIILFSTPFDRTSADFLEKMDVPAYKIASFENVDIPLIRHVARKGKPVILSTGMATEAEIDRAVSAIREQGNDRIILLKCTSAYPAKPEEMNLAAIPWLSQRFGTISGLSDHSLDNRVSLTAVALGASVIEKHFTESREDGGPDSHFSMEPAELKELVQSIRFVEKTLGVAGLRRTEDEAGSIVFRRSLFAVRDIEAGGTFTEENVRSIRPGHGLPPGEMDRILGKTARSRISKGTPLKEDGVAGWLDD